MPQKRSACATIWDSQRVVPARCPHQHEGQLQRMFLLTPFDLTIIERMSQAKCLPISWDCGKGNGHSHSLGILQQYYSLGDTKCC